MFLLRHVLRVYANPVGPSLYRGGFLSAFFPDPSGSLSVSALPLWLEMVFLVRAVDWLVGRFILCLSS